MVWNRWSRILQFVSVSIPQSWAWEIATGKIMNGGKIFLCQSCPFTVRWSKNQSSLTQILFQSECFELSFKIFIIKKNCDYSTVFEDPKVLSTGIIVFDHQKLSKPFGVFMFLFQNGVAEGGDWKTYRIIPPYLVLLEYEYYSFFCPQFVLIGQEIFNLSFLAALSQGHDFGILGVIWGRSGVI